MILTSIFSLHYSFMSSGKMRNNRNNAHEAAHATRRHSSSCGSLFRRLGINKCERTKQLAPSFILFTILSGRYSPVVTFYILRLLCMAGRARTNSRGPEPARFATV